MPSIPLELETDLRLHTQRLELGKAELITDAITLPFIDLEKQLHRHRTNRSPEAIKELRYSMKAYLSRLNANPLLPLQFRLKVLNRFERELDLFDAQTTAAILNSYKIAVEMLQEAARTEPEYYPSLMDITATALELAIQLLRYDLEAYRSSAIITIRQVFSLTRLGLGVLPALPGGSEDACSRFQKAVSVYELSRALNFFQKSVSEQKIMSSLLEEHAKDLHPYLCLHHGHPPSMPGKVFLVSKLSKPNETPRISSTLPETFSTDAIVIPVDAFLASLVKNVKKSKRLLDNSDLQKEDMHTEDALRITMTGSSSILNALSIKKRASRYEYRKTRAYLEWDLERIFIESQGTLSMDGYEFAPFEWSSQDAWWVTDISKTGVGLERTSSHKLSDRVGSMVGLKWPKHKGEPELGFIRWFREPKTGEQRLGIEFLQGKQRLMKASLAGGTMEPMYDLAPWHVIAEQAIHSLRVLSPEKDIFEGTVLNISNADQENQYKVSHIIQTGPNYILFLADLLSEKQQIVKSQNL
ncbi:MAG: hypothetical protein ACE5DY_05245 [Mariprofundaceae bacterium]